MGRIICIVFPFGFLFPFLFLSLSVQSQWDFTNVDTTTFGLYNRSEWKILSNFGESAIEQGLDYYYLRMRTGIAYYELQEYIPAIPHFRKALRFNQGDAVASEYLYFCLLNSGQIEQAQKWLFASPSDTREKVAAYPKVALNFVAFEGGIRFPDNVPTGFGNMNYFNLNAGHYGKKGLGWLHSFTIVGQATPQNKFTQGQYYLRASIPLKNGFLLRPATHLVLLNTKTPPDSIPPVTLPPPPPIVSNYFNPVLSMGIYRQSGRFSGGLNVLYSNFQPSQQVQGGLSLGYAPLKNNRLGFGVNAYLHQDLDSSQTSFAVSPWVRYSVGKKVNLYANALWNTSVNLVEENGFLVNNNRDATRLRLLFWAGYRISRQTEISLFYSYEQKESALNGNIYFYHSPYMGLKFYL